MNVDLYLKKLNIESEAPTLRYLNKLLTAHQKVISFNNLTVYFNPGKILNLELEPLFEKVIERGEGGYCFENNKVFYYLLSELGFEVEAKLARVVYDKEGDIPRTHRVTIVSIQDERYLADVGFGRDVPPEAVLLNKEESSGHQVIKTGDIYCHQLLKNNTMINLYTFDEGKYQESDFTLANYYTNTHPDSKFLKEVIVTRREEGLIEFINGRIFSKIENGVRADETIGDQAQFEGYLRRFGLLKSYAFEKLPLSL